MNALVVFATKERQDFVAWLLEVYAQMTSQTLSSAKEALSLFQGPQARSAFQLVVCDLEKDGKELIDYIRAQKIPAVVLAVGNHPPQDPSIPFISCASFSEHLKAKLQAVKGLAPPPDPEYTRIQPELLLQANPLKGDISVRLSEQKFVRIFREGHEFTRDDLENYSKKRKFDHFYLKSTLVSAVALQIQSRVFPVSTQAPAKAAPVVTPAPALPSDLEDKKKRLEELQAKKQALEQQKAQVVEKKKEPEKPPVKTPAPTPPPPAASTALEEDPVKLAAISKTLEKELGSELESVYQMSRNLGFSKHVQEMTKQGVMATVQSIRKAPRLSALLYQLRRDKEKYLSSHSMLLAYVSCALASQMQWSSDSTFNKLTLASFLHDAALVNHELAAIQSLAELKQKESQFTPEELKAYREHPVLGANIARKFTEIPPDVDLIIAQHHERPDGRGFPRNLMHTRIGPLATVFIVAHELVSFLMKNETLDPAASGTHLKRFLEMNHNQYQSGNFRKVLMTVSRVK